MAADNLAAIASALSTTMDSQIKRQWNRIAVGAATIPASFAVGQGGGKQITWDVEFTGAAAASAAEGSDIGAGEYLQDPIVPAVLSYGYYRSAFALSNLEMAAAAASMGNAAALGNIAMERMIGSAAKIASTINSDIWTGTGVDGSGNPTIVGFAGAVTGALLASGSYGGLSKATYPEWAGNVLANGGTPRPLTMDLLYNAEQLVYVGTGLPLDVIYCSPGVFRKYAGLFESRIRTDAGVGGTPGSYSGGFTGDMLFWKGIQILRDKDLPTGTMILGNRGEVELKVLPAAGSTLSSQLEGNPFALPSSNGESMNPTGLVCQVYPLGRTGSAVKFFGETFVQLKVKRVKAFALLQDISE